MTVETEMPAIDLPTTGSDTRAGTSTDTAELLRTMAAVVRTVFGVALQAPAEQPVQQAPAEPAQLAPVAISLPSEAPTLVSVPVTMPEAPAAIAVDFPAALPVEQVHQVEAPQEPVGLTIVPDPEPAGSIPMPAITVDGSWAAAPQPPDESYAEPHVQWAAEVEPAASLPMPMPDSYPAPIQVPSYSPAAVATQIALEPPVDRHSMALLQEIAFLDD